MQQWLRRCNRQVGVVAAAQSRMKSEFRSPTLIKKLGSGSFMPGINRLFVKNRPIKEKRSERRKLRSTALWQHRRALWWHNACLLGGIFSSVPLPRVWYWYNIVLAYNLHVLLKFGLASKIYLAFRSRILLPLIRQKSQVWILAPSPLFDWTLTLSKKFFLCP